MAGIDFSQRIRQPTDYEKKLIMNMIEDGITCSICLDTFKKPVGIECNHVFCNQCLKSWMRSKTSCPMCRRHIFGDPIPCDWLESIIRDLKGTPIAPINYRRSSAISVNSRTMNRGNNGKENWQRPPWR